MISSGGPVDKEYEDEVLKMEVLSLDIGDSFAIKDKDEKMVGFLAGLAAGIAIGTKLASQNQPFTNNVTNDVPTLCAANIKKKKTLPTAAVKKPKESLIQVLQKVNSIINPRKDPEKVKERNEAITVFVDKVLIEKLKALDVLFDKLYRKIVWSGSYYDGLKINDVDEYDLNVVLRLPFPQNKLQVSTVNLESGEKAEPAFVFVNNFKQAVKEIEANKNLDYIVYKKMESWCDDKGTLLQSKVRPWFQSLMTKMLLQNREIIEQEFGKVTLRESGPAMTLIFKDENLSIDLVPTFEFQTSGSRAMMPPQPFRQPSDDWPWYIIPKPFKKRPDLDRAENYGCDMWRLSFCSHEKELIQGKESLKPSIKLIKKLRDTHKMNNLCSYFIKTLFLWEVCEEDCHDNSLNDSCDWRGDLGQVFMKMLERLFECLEKEEIKFFWDDRCNLLDGLGSLEIMNLKHKVLKLLKKFRTNLDENPSTIGEAICPEYAITMKNMENEM